MQEKSRILLIDDDAIVQLLFEDTLTRVQTPVEYTFRQSAQEGLNYLSNCQTTGTFPHYIIVDLKMPVMDGFEFIEQYEKVFYTTHPDTKLYVLSSSISDKDKSRAFSFDSVKDFVSKPLQAEKLSTLIGE